MTKVPLLAVRGVCAHADGADTPLLDGVDLTVPAGSVTAVVGPSGSGKTTLGLAALASARAGVRLEGEVLLEGTELLSLPESRRRAVRSGTVGHLPQHPEAVLDPVRRTGGALRELAALRHTGRSAQASAVDAALEAAGLPDRQVRRRFPHQLSGGQQQRVALATALVTGARLLVLDEPTSGLDPVTGEALTRRLRGLVDDGAGLLLLSHDLALVRTLATRVTVLQRGRAVEQGLAADVLNGPNGAAHSVTRGLLSAERRTGSRTAGASSVPAQPAPAGDGTPKAGAAEGGGAMESAPEGAAGPARTPEGVHATAVSVRHRAGRDRLAGPVTMAFPPDSRTALIGVSGAGKTTFGRLLAGLTPATSGKVTYGGARLPHRLERRTTAQLRAVQYVHQDSADSFEAHLPLLGQLAAAGRLLRGMSAEAAEAEARDIAHQLGLDDTLTARTPARLSGGQLQRCALARALMARPALLVCDEVTSALDTMAREQVLTTLVNLLAPTRTALLLISHDLATVREIADSVAVLDAGRCVQHANLPDFLHAPLPGAPTDLVRATDGPASNKRPAPIPQNT